MDDELAAQFEFPSRKVLAPALKPRSTDPSRASSMFEYAASRAEWIGVPSLAAPSPLF
jgi:hypothetical protein